MDEADEEQFGPGMKNKLHSLTRVIERCSSATRNNNNKM